MNSRGPGRGPGSAGLLAGLGALVGLATVVMGALGAHALAGRLDAVALGTFRTALAYQGLHALALVATGLLEHQAPSRWARAAGALFLAGTLLFCGSIYIKLLAGVAAPGAITPVGGIAFMAGWVCLAGAAGSLGRRR